MSSTIRWRLSLMMFLQFAVWGAYFPVLGAYLTDLKFSGGQVAWIFGMLPLATIVAPMIFGQIADRYLPTQWLLGGLHLIGGLLLWLLAAQTDFQPFRNYMLLFSFAYAPTLVLTNSLSFSHIRNAEKEFGGIRVLGSIGWMVAGYSLTALLRHDPHMTLAVSLRLAAGFAFALGLFCFFLPHTPPRREGSNPWAFLEAFRLLKDRNFLIFIIISFVVATELQFYYIFTSDFLKHVGVAEANVSSVMTTAQAAEIIVMAILLPLLLPRLGVRKAMIIGILAWPIRYGIFALAANRGTDLQWLVIASLTLHGFCYVFFFTVGWIYVDRVAHADIRASAQSLINIVTMGGGLYIGSFIAGWLKDYYTHNSVTNWQNLFLVPCVLTVLCAIVFPFLFRETGTATLQEPRPQPTTA